VWSQKDLQFECFVELFLTWAPRRWPNELFTLLGSIYNVENIINNMRQNVNLSRSVYVKSSSLIERILHSLPTNFLY
jgi:hypothetical protein